MPTMGSQYHTGSKQNQYVRTVGISVYLLQEYSEYYLNTRVYHTVLILY